MKQIINNIQWLQKIVKNVLHKLTTKMREREREKRKTIFAQKVNKNEKKK